MRKTHPKAHKEVTPNYSYPCELMGRQLRPPTQQEQLPNHGYQPALIQNKVY